MRKAQGSMTVPRLVLFTIATAVMGCASKHDTRGPFVTSAPFSKTIPGSGDTVCWSVKRALLGQGYMLDRSSESGVLTGTRDAQPEKKVNVTVRLQTTCADNRNGTSIVFVTAEREVSKLQKMKQSTSAGIGPATITMPAGSAKVLGVVRRETIDDPNFYNSFFALVEGFVAQEGRAHVEQHAEISKQGDQAH
ncbi:MAG TPA: DUF2242 domain-containing protein [Steroidobacteraceae bacterium]